MSTFPNTGSFTATGIANQQLSDFNSSVEQYGSFSGTNITVHINHVPVGTLMGISYTIHTEKQAQYTFGSPTPRRFTTGKRGIAGNLIFNTFDRNALLSIYAGSNLIGQPMASVYSQNANANSPFGGRFGELGNPIPAYNPLGARNYTGVSTAFTQGQDANAFNTSIQSDFQDAYANAFWVPLEYADQLPPFDVTLTMVDPQGNGAYMVIGGVEIMNESGQFTVDDLTNQTSYAYVARYVRPITPISRDGNTGSTTPYITSSQPATV